MTTVLHFWSDLVLVRVVDSRGVRLIEQGYIYKVNVLLIIYLWVYIRNHEEREF